MKKIHSIDTLKRCQGHIKRLIELEQPEEISLQLNEIYAILQHARKGLKVLATGNFNTALDIKQKN